jgi:hypothetical protein
VNESLRREVLVRLAAAQAPADWLEAVKEVVAVKSVERQAAFGDDLPVGLKLVDSTG